MKNNLSPVSPKLSTTLSQTSKQNKPINSLLNNNKSTTIVTHNKSVPPIPPRKSSILTEGGMDLLGNFLKIKV
jgi:hypothetical protein